MFPVSLLPMSSVHTLTLSESDISGLVESQGSRPVPARVSGPGLGGLLEDDLCPDPADTGMDEKTTSQSKDCLT